MRLLLVLLALATQSIWTAKCVANSCTLDGTKSTGTIADYAWTQRHGKDSVLLGHGAILRATLPAGVDTVRLSVYDATVKRWYYSTKYLTVTAPTLPPVARVDTVRLPSKPDTIRRVDTVRVGSSSVLFARPWGALVDSSRSGPTMVVHWTTFLGTLRKYEKGYVAYGQDSLPIVKGVPVPVSLDSAVTLLSPKSLSVKVGP